MSISRIEFIKKLINSLDKSEKRALKVYSNRIQREKDKMFVQLYNAIEKKPLESEEYYRTKLNLSTYQYINLKRHLYTQILRSLRLVNIQKSPTIKLREEIDYATLLYDKGLHNQCLQYLSKLKSIAKNNGRNIAYLDIIELHKKIESRHITRSRGVVDKMENLIQESSDLNNEISQAHTLSNLGLKIQGLYIKVGHVKNEKDRVFYKIYFESLGVSDIITPRNSKLRALWHECNIWYNHAQMRPHYSYRHAIRWAECYQNNKQLMDNDPISYLRSLHYVMVQCYHIDRADRHTLYLNEYRKYRDKRIGSYTHATSLIDYIYYNHARLNQMLLSNKYASLNNVITDIESGYKIYRHSVDIHRRLTMYYKLAMIYSYNGKYNLAIDYTNQIINHIDVSLKKDLVTYSRLLHIMCHFHLGNYLLVENLVDSIRAEFTLTDQLNKVVETVLSFLKRASKMMHFGMDDDTNKLKNKLMEYKQDEYEKIAFLYYNYINWCDSLLRGIPITKIIKAITT